MDKNTNETGRVIKLTDEEFDDLLDNLVDAMSVAEYDLYKGLIGFRCALCGKFSDPKTPTLNQHYDNCSGVMLDSKMTEIIDNL